MERMGKALALAGPVVAVGILAFAPRFSREAGAYPPGTGITGKFRNCVACHTNDGPWKEDSNLIVDLVDKETGRSVRQDDGTFLVSAKPGQARTLMAVIGRAKGDVAPAPNRNGWIFIDPTLIDKDMLGSKFAPGWETNLTMSCRLVGDTAKGHEGARVTSLPLTVRPSEAAKDTEVEWQILMTSGDAVKGDATQGLTQNYFLRKVRLKVEK